MSFVYHRVPSQMVGEIIYPLNQLASIAPDAYELQKSKYLGREAVLDARISETDLRFSDTVHCAPLHPHRLFTARDAHGFNAQAVNRGVGASSGLFFEIPLDRIADHPVLWYRWETFWINGAPGDDVAQVPPLEEFEPFDPGRYRELADIPDAHLSYLRRMKDLGKRPLLFVHIPHVLVAGPIDTQGLRVIRWDEPARTG
jgi:hypothetical protein